MFELRPQGEKGLECSDKEGLAPCSQKWGGGSQLSLQSESLTDWPFSILSLCTMRSAFRRERRRRTWESQSSRPPVGSTADDCAAHFVVRLEKLLIEL